MTQKNKRKIGSKSASFSRRDYALDATYTQFLLLDELNKVKFRTLINKYQQ